MSWSRGAWLGFGAALMVMLFAWPRKAWMGAALVIGAIVSGLFLLRAGLLPSAIADRATGFSEFVQSFDARGQDITPENYAVLERLAHWQAAEAMAQYNFWFGVGIGNYEPVYPAYALINWPYPLGHAHNIYLNTLAEMGIIGLAAYIALWGVIYWHTWLVTRSADVWMRFTAIGLMGTWTHLSVHSFLDKLYVANLHLHIGALLGVLSILIAIRQRGRQSGDRHNN
jgi:putative inorganic carbon (hco3(-)) transporter